ncbi:TPA: hypothetical protein ACKB4M_001810 [Streptococcus pneumoniae]
MAKSNFEKVESVVGWVRDKKITGYRISKETNAREMSIIALAQGRAKVKNISFETALGLIDFYEKNHEKVVEIENLPFHFEDSKKTARLMQPFLFI